MKTNFKKGMMFFALVCLVGTLFTGSVLANDSVKGEKSKLKLQRIKITEEEKAELKAGREEGKISSKGERRGKILCSEMSEEQILEMKEKMPMKGERIGKGLHSEMSEEQILEMKEKMQEGRGHKGIFRKSAEENQFKR